MGADRGLKAAGIKVYISGEATVEAISLRPIHGREAQGSGCIGGLRRPRRSRLPLGNMALRRPLAGRAALSAGGPRQELAGARRLLVLGRGGEARDGDSHRARYGLLGALLSGRSKEDHEGLRHLPRRRIGRPGEGPCGSGCYACVNPQKVARPDSNCLCLPIALWRSLGAGWTLRCGGDLCGVVGKRTLAGVKTNASYKRMVKIIFFHIVKLLLIHSLGGWNRLALPICGDGIKRLFRSCQEEIEGLLRFPLTRLLFCFQPALEKCRERQRLGLFAGSAGISRQDEVLLCNCVMPT